VGIKVKKKICDGCNKPQYIWKRDGSNLYCKICWGKIKLKQDGYPVVKRSRPKQKSKKKSAQDTVYSQLRRVFLTKHPMCQAHLPGICTQKSTDVHHTARRGENYLKVSTWMAVCRKCHGWIEENPEEAKDLGFLR